MAVTELSYSEAEAQKALPPEKGLGTSYLTLGSGSIKLERVALVQMGDLGVLLNA
jgi:hypothetical protein